jgi:transglutaminase-like putative cysteine protease
MEKRSERWLDLPSIICLILALWLIALRLQMTDWTKKLELGSLIVFIGFFLGLALGYSYFNKRAVLWLGMAYSFFVLSWQLSMLIDMKGKISDRLYQLGLNIWQAFTFFLQNQPVPNSYLFLTLIAVLMWLIALTAGYSLSRYGKPWISVAVGGVALTIIDQYSTFVKGRNFISGLFVFAVLCLIGRLYFLQKQIKWEKSGALVDYGLGFDVGRTMAASSLILVLVTWSIPGLVQYFIPGSVPQQKMFEFWKPLRERLANTVADLRSPRSVSSRIFGENLSLGTQATEGDNPVFLVDVSSRRSMGLRYYWRAYSYDTYTKGQWSDSIDDQKQIDPGDWPLASPDWGARKQVDLVFHMQYSNSTTLYSPGSPLAINLPVKLIAQNLTAGTDINDVAMTSTNAIKSGDGYQLRASVAIPSDIQLQSSGLDYPGYILDKYLQLPDDLPQRIENLAKEITRKAQTPFEKTIAITDYLRDTIQYQKSIEPAPGYYDPIDWFLFVQKKGYCNYYASAEVLMLRAVGVPTRLAVGFAQGIYIKESESFQVNFNDAHAWPEVFFPGIGWVEFEPTVSQPNIQYQTALAQQTTGNPGYYGGGYLSPFYERMFDERLDPEFAGNYAAIPPKTLSNNYLYYYLLLIPLLLLIVWFFIRKNPRFRNMQLPILLESLFRKRGRRTPKWIQFFAQRARMSPIEKYFSEISWMLRLLGKRVTQNQTPSERVSLVVSLLPEIKDPANRLLNEYQRSIYSPYQGDVKLARKAHSELWKYVVGTYFRSLIHPKLSGI